MRVCSEPGCPELVENGRCTAHRRSHEQRRGTRQSRGYDRRYELTRTRWARTVAAGEATCWSCLKRISPLEPWDLGHCDNDRATIHGPQHTPCNRDTSGLGCVHVSHQTHTGMGGDSP